MSIADNIATWFLIFIVYSIIGWCMEELVSIVMYSKITNRGFLLGPVCPIYGWGALLLTFLLRNVTNIPIIFFISIVASAILEYLTSYIMEKLFRVRWWDYSEKPLNLHGRICAENLLVFGIMGVLVIRGVNPLLLSAISSISPALRIGIAVTFLIIMLLDVAVALWLIIVCRVTVGTTEVDATDEITRRVRQILCDKGKIKGKLNRRMVNAFPTMEAKKKTITRRSRSSTKTTATRQKPQN